MRGRRRRVADELYAGPGFEPFGLDALVKFGGSLLADVGEAARAGAELRSLASERALAVFPGGGPTDVLLEGIAARAGVPSDVVNPALMRALDQTGIVLASMTPGAVAVEDLASLRAALADGDMPVLLPSALILALDVFTRVDVITSDTLGAFFAFLTGARTYVVLTNVDGVYEGFSGGEPSGRLVEDVTAAELERLGATSVDRCLGPFLRTVGLDAWVVNGRRPERVRDALEGRRPVGTRIRA